MGIKGLLRVEGTMKVSNSIANFFPLESFKSKKVLKFTKNSSQMDHHI